ncbi:Mevalonyl-coenzyme A hydratase sidH-like protein [Elsinoe fawcettii]|nr:Mevalonyl-coenzyme A hydratase sidH-like protein [Elsinoe fawcettii]
MAFQARQPPMRHHDYHTTAQTRHVEQHVWHELRRQMQPCGTPPDRHTAYPLSPLARSKDYQALSDTNRILPGSKLYTVADFTSEWNNANQSNQRRPMPPSGFGALSRRNGLKPVIAAVNGICFGGGCEIIVNCDLVLASTNATIALPEVKRGVVAIAGALPRIVRTIGRPRAMEMALTGRVVPAKEAETWGLINKVVEGDVVAAAVEMAEAIAENSPDAVIVSREGVKLGWEGVGAEEGSRLLVENWYPRLLKGENIKEGVQAFVEKRKPKWKAAKL